MAPSELLNELKEYFVNLGLDVYDKQPQSANGLLSVFGEENCIWVNIPTETRKILCKFGFHENDDKDIIADFCYSEGGSVVTYSCYANIPEYVERTLRIHLINPKITQKTIQHI